jgi:hypothetical protein
VFLSTVRHSCTLIFSLYLEETFLQYIAFEDLEAAELNYRIGAGMIIRVVSEKPVLDTLYNDSVYAGCRCLQGAHGVEG